MGRRRQELLDANKHTHKFKKGQPDDNTKAKGEMYVRSLHFNLVLLFPFVAILELQLCNFCRKFVKFFLWQGNCYPSFIVLKMFI